MFGFGGNKDGNKKSDIKATSREAQRTLNHSKRDIEREIASCDRTEKELITKIQLAHKQNRQSEVKLLAKQLVQTRETRDRLHRCTGQISGAAMKTKALATNAVMADTIAGATKAISSVNAVVDPKTVMKDMNNFSREMDKMEVAAETWDDMVDLFDGDGAVEEESDVVVNSVLDELGINIGAQMVDAPTNNVFANIPGMQDYATGAAAGTGGNRAASESAASSSSSSSARQAVS